MPQLSRFTVTFGLNYNLGRHYVAVEAPDIETARQLFLVMRRSTPSCPECQPNVEKAWAFIYPPDEYWKSIERWGFTCVSAYEPVHYVECSRSTDPIILER